MQRPVLEVADIFRAHGPTWRQRERGHLSLGQLKVMSAIEQCRSAALGGHALRCSVCAAQNPETFLKLWWRRQPRMYNTGYGIYPVRKFIEKSRPIRVWYNVGATNTSNEKISGLLAASVDAGLGTEDYPIVPGPSSGGSYHLKYPVERSIGSAIVVIDPAQVAQLNIGQFSDYIAMVSFAEINQDANLSANSTILNLFATLNATVPLEITPWDKALLRALYTSDHGARVQMSQMEQRHLSAKWHSS